MATSSKNQNHLRRSLTLCSAIAGLICLSKSSFSEMQLEDTKSIKTVIFVILTAIFIAYAFVGSRWISFLETVCNLHFSIKAMVNSFFLMIVGIVIFLIKYPRFNIHFSKYRKFCMERYGEISHKSQLYNLFSVGAFALLALVVSSERHQPIELGFFSILLALTMDNSMEIPGSNGPNLWYMLSASLYCVGLIFIRSYMHYSTQRVSTNYEHVRSSAVEEVGCGIVGASTRNILRNSLSLFLAAVGIVCLFLCPFSQEQFVEAANLKSVCFIIFSLLLGFFIPKAPQCIDLAVKGCERHFQVKAMVNSFLLMIASGVNFLTKYPRFKVHSKYRELNCMDEKGKEVSRASKFDLFSAAAFSLFSLVASSERQKSMELGIFSFLLELTMDASIELLGKHEPNSWYVLGAFVYCVVLIFVSSYLDSYFMRNGNNIAVEPNDQEDSRLPEEDDPTNLDVVLEIIRRDEIYGVGEHDAETDDIEKEYEFVDTNTENVSLDRRISMELEKGEIYDNQGLRRRWRKKKPTEQEVKQQKELQPLVLHSENQALSRSTSSLISYPTRSASLRILRAQSMSQLLVSDDIRTSSRSLSPVRDRNK